MQKRSLSRRSSLSETFIVACVCVLIVFLVVPLFSMMSVEGDNNSGVGTIYYDLNDLPTTKFDAILVLGGGVPLSVEEPPIFVQKRCDDAAAIIHKQGELMPILSLSAGTTHRPQLLSDRGLPVWESTASSAYLKKKYKFDSNLYVETTSFDTIGNAYFARTSHTDIAGWRKLMVITNKFHIGRTKEIFDWIFGIGGGGDVGYKLYYFGSEDVGLTEEALEARRAHEARGAITVREKLAPQHQTLRQVWEFLTEKHDLYTATKLVDGANQVPNDANSANLRASYGAK